MFCRSCDSALVVVAAPFSLDARALEAACACARSNEHHANFYGAAGPAVIWCQLRCVP